jgi:hypothetical protein
MTIEIPWIKEEMARLKAELEAARERILNIFHHHLRPIIHFSHFYHDKNFNYMAILTSLTLTSTAPVDLAMVVVDANNNNTPIAGTLTGVSYTLADPTQDAAVPDPVTPNEVDIHAILLTGGTVVTATGTFVSTAVGTDGKTPLFSGTVTGTLTLVNNIPATTLAPVLTFNQ